jgi:hypothetical protein
VSFWAFRTLPRLNLAISIKLHTEGPRERSTKEFFFSFLFGEAKTTMLLMKSESEKKEGIFVEFFTVSIVLGVV